MFRLWEGKALFSSRPVDKLEHRASMSATAAIQVCAYRIEPVEPQIHF